MMALFSEGFLWSLFCLWKELYSKIAAAPLREKHRPTREAWRMFLSVLLILHHLPFSCPDSVSSSFWLYLTLCLTRISPALSVSLTASDADAPFDKPVVLEICQSFICFFPPEARGVWNEIEGQISHTRWPCFVKQKTQVVWMPVCSTLLLPPSSSAASSSSLPLLHSSLHCTLCPCHSLFPFPPSFPFTERLEPEASVTVSMGIDFSDSTQAANFQLW